MSQKSALKSIFWPSYDILHERGAFLHKTDPQDDLIVVPLSILLNGKSNKTDPFGSLSGHIQPNAVKIDSVGLLYT